MTNRLGTASFSVQGGCPRALPRTAPRGVELIESPPEESEFAELLEELQPSYADPLLVDP
jgi:hypothetical protein